MGLTEPDRHEVMMRERRTELRDAIELREILADVDSDGSNTLSTSEFEQVCQIPEFRHFLNSRGIHIKEAGTFFAMVAQSVGAGADIDIDTMIGCCLRIRGHATSIDLHTLRFEMRALLAEQRHALDELRLQMGLASQPPTPKLPKMISPVTRGQAPA
ncbi:unnamed protein product [Prorocentrum cordatum]|uniref:EF-hand domain-containing protein n=1 Tax=Prorocentrum cordatum TaxID=2364126 RepID=A0ABN9T375_9DINO|nr:unnamed protein product [Polarella glacialis]